MEFLFGTCFYVVPPGSFRMKFARSFYTCNSNALITSASPSRAMYEATSKNRMAIPAYGVSSFSGLAAVAREL